MVTKLRGENGTKGGGNSSAYLLRKIQRANRPDILARYEAGEFPSVRAAAREAGLVKEPSPFEIACRQIDKLTPAERHQLKEML